MLHDLIERMTEATPRTAPTLPSPPLSPHDALILWMLGLPLDADYGAAAHAALAGLPEAGPGETLLSQFRALLAEVAAHGGPASVARQARAIRRRRPGRADA